jgi:hypothetical protein
MRHDIGDLRARLAYHLAQAKRIRRQIKRYVPKRRKKATLTDRILDCADHATTAEIAAACSCTTAYVRKVLTAKGWKSSIAMLPTVKSDARRKMAIWTAP